MRIESLKISNVTLLFAAPINHALIIQQDLNKLFKTGDEKQDQRAFIEAPGFKVMAMPNQQKEIIFEAARILVNDKSGREIGNSTIIDDAMTVLDSSDSFSKSAITAYGFNYDVATVADNMKVSDILGAKMAAVADIKTAGVTIGFAKDNVKYQFDLRPVGDTLEKFHAHFNAHFATNALPDKETLRDQFNQKYAEFEALIARV